MFIQQLIQIHIILITKIVIFMEYMINKQEHIYDLILGDQILI